MNIQQQHDKNFREQEIATVSVFSPCIFGEGISPPPKKITYNPPKRLPNCVL